MTSPWIEETTIKRLAQRSNVFIEEILDDYLRIAQLRTIFKTGQLDKLFKTEYDHLIEYNVQRQELWELKTGTGKPNRLQYDPMATSAIKEIDNMLLGTQTAVMAHYVFGQQHADALSDNIAAWSQDSTIYDKNSTFFVFTSNSNLFSESLRRLAYTITVEASTEEERRTVLEDVAKDYQTSVETKYKGTRTVKLKITEDILKGSSGLNLHQTQTAALESIATSPTRDITLKAFTDMKIKSLQETGMEFIIPKNKYSLVGGEELLKGYTTDNVIVPLRDPELAEKYGIGIPKGMIICGIPGTGKDYFTEATAYELGLAMIKLTPTDFFKPVVGESESAVKRTFNLIESMGRIVVYIPEIDQMLMKRGSVAMTDSGVQRRITDMFLDRTGKRDRQYFLMGSTNYIDQMDNAGIRPGRFDECVLQMPPNTVARKQILIIHTTQLRQMPLASDIDFDSVAEKTFGWTPAELEKLCLTAGRAAMKQKAEKVTNEHFTYALGTITINMAEREQRLHDMIAAMKKLDVVSKQFIDASFDSFKQGETTDESRVKSFFGKL